MEEQAKAGPKKLDEEIPAEIKQALLKDMYDNHYKRMAGLSFTSLGWKISANSH